MKIAPIRFVKNIEAALHFYSALGLAENAAATSGTWAEMPCSGGLLGLHIAQASSADAAAVSLQFAADERLEAVVARLETAGFRPSAIVDETFGRFFTVEDPDGLLVQVNEMDEELRNRSYEVRESAALK